MGTLTGKVSWMALYCQMDSSVVNTSSDMSTTTHIAFMISDTISTNNNIVNAICYTKDIIQIILVTDISIVKMNGSNENCKIMM